MIKGQGHQAALGGCTGRPTWTYRNGDLSICVHDVYHVITCRPGRGISWRLPVYSFLFHNSHSTVIRTSRPGSGLDKQAVGGRPPQYAPASYVTLTFDLLTLKVVSESRVTWELPLLRFSSS